MEWMPKEKYQRTLESVIDFMGSENLPLARWWPLRETLGCRWEPSSDIYKAVRGKKGEAYSLWTQSGDLRPKVFRENEIQNL